MPCAHHLESQHPQNPHEYNYTASIFPTPFELTIPVNTVDATLVTNQTSMLFIRENAASHQDMGIHSPQA